VRTDDAHVPDGFSASARIWRLGKREVLSVETMAGERGNSRCACAEHRIATTMVMQSRTDVESFATPKIVASGRPSLEIRLVTITFK
jgi:hypothetical protein